MNIAEARKLLTDRHSRIHDAYGMIYIGLSLEDAEAIAGLLPAGDPPAAVPPETPTELHMQRIDTSVRWKPEKVVDTESGPVKVPQKKTAKKKTKKRGKR